MKTTTILAVVIAAPAFAHPVFDTTSLELRDTEYAHLFPSHSDYVH